MSIFYKIKSLPRSFKRGIKSIIYWFPLIWENNWWDSDYLLILMRHQLKLMEKHWVVDTIHEGDEMAKYDMGLCIECLDRLLEDSYFDNVIQNGEIDKHKMRIGVGNRQADIDVLFNTIRDNYRDWWD